MAISPIYMNSRLERAAILPWTKDPHLLNGVPSHHSCLKILVCCTLAITHIFMTDLSISLPGTTKPLRIQKPIIVKQASERSFLESWHDAI